MPNLEFYKYLRLRYRIVQPIQSHNFSPGQISPGQFSPGDILVQETIQSKTIQSRQFSLSQCSPDNLVWPIQSKKIQSRSIFKTVQSGNQFSPGDFLVQDNLVHSNIVWEPIQSEKFSLGDNIVQPIQSDPRQFSPANLVQDKLVHNNFSNYNKPLRKAITISHYDKPLR